MNDFDVDVQSASATAGAQPIKTHKITFTRKGSTETYVVWYYKNAPAYRDFDKKNDWGLVTWLGDTCIPWWKVGEHVSTSIGPGQYFVQRTDHLEFVVHSLR